MKRRICLHLMVLCALLLPALPGAPAQTQDTIYIYVDWEADGAHDGSSWSDAFTNLQDALDAAGSDNEIWVAAGTYMPTVPTDPLDARTATFQLKSGVAIYGGFDPSMGATEFDDRDWKGHLTILSGDIGSAGQPEDWAYHVVTGSGVDDTAVLDGFLVGFSQADLADGADCGGGMFNEAGSPTLRHLTFEKNFGIYGAAMCNRDGSNPELVDVTFYFNMASGMGGGMFNDASNPILTDVVFVENTAEDGGGGMANVASSPTLSRVRVEGNRSEHNGGGGGVLNSLDSNPMLTDVEFYNNYAGPNQQGGGMFSSGGTATLTRVTFHQNHAWWGGGISIAGSLQLTDCTIRGNLAENDGGGILVNSSTLTLENSLIQGNRAMGSGGGLANSGGSVQVSSSRFSGNVALGGGGLNSSGEGSTTVIHGSTFDQNDAMEGGALRNDGSGHMDIINSTISGNEALEGAGIHTTSWDGTDVYNVTVTGNVAGGGGGLFNEDGTFRLYNSILAGNEDRSPEPKRPDCWTAEISLPLPVPFVEYTLIGDGTGCDGLFDAGPGNLLGDSDDPLDPLLGRLAYHGGPTPTHALLSGSPARDAGDPGGCTDHEGDPLVTDQRGVERPRDGGAGEPLRCDMGAYEAGLGNDAWMRAQPLELGGDPLQASTEEYIDKLGQSRWYKFSVYPGSRVTVKLTDLPANYDLMLYRDIDATYQDLAALQDEQDLVRLGAEFAPDMYSPDMYSPDMYSPDMYSPDMYSPDMYSPDMYSPDMYSPDMYSPDMYSPDARTYASAQVRSAIAASAFDGTAGEVVVANTWDNSGDFYIRVRGRNGAFDLSAPFHLDVTQEVGVCGGVDLIKRADPPAVAPGAWETLVLVDWERMDLDPQELSELQGAVNVFAAQVGGVAIDVGADPLVDQANAEADDLTNIACPFAKNQVAGLIKDIVDAYRQEHPLQYVVIIGNDNVIPYFRYPDRALLANEKNYVPPVARDTASHASLALGYVLSQDAYGASVDLSLGNTALPVADLAVGRLVETPAEILTLLVAYPDTTGGVIPLETALVTGYDFLADAAHEITGELEDAGIGAMVTLIDERGTSPLDPGAWTADDLRAPLLDTGYDLVFLAGHFTASSALASDYASRLLASDLEGAPADLTNALIYSPGCHSAYNIVNEHGIPGVTAEPDWAQAFARRGATVVGGTGYQYGDTDFVEYGERLYLEFTRALRCGPQPTPIGQALVAAKQAYLAGTAQMRGIHEKTLLEATLYGLPMLKVSGLNGAGCPSDPPSTVSAVEYDTPPGSILHLYHATVPVFNSLTPRTVELSDADGNTLTATYLEGGDGVVTNPAEPALPLERRNVSVPGLVLRGVGFRGGTYFDTLGVAPLTGAATTEIRGVHAPFRSKVFYPIRPWRANYLDALTDPGSGATWLDVTPAQFISTEPEPWYGTLRQFDEMEFRLFYSNNTSTYSGNVPALAAPPAIVKVEATDAGAQQVAFRVTVLGDPAAGIQEVWVTYTTCEEGGACDGVWRSLDLQQKNPDTESMLWEEDLDLIANGITADEIRYMVQAVNGVGLVTLATNMGEYFRVGLDPADPSAGGDPALPPAPTVLSPLSPPDEGAYGSEVELRVQLTSNGLPLAGQRVKFALGALQRWATTGVDGVATVYVPLLAAPGAYELRVTFPGTAEYLRSSTTSGFTITQQPTQLSLDPAAATAQYSDDSGLIAALTDADMRPLREKTVLFVVSDGARSTATAAVANLVSEASLGPIPLPAGSYDITAYFGDEVVLPDGTVDMTDAYYGASQAYGTLEVDPENATVTYIGDTSVPEGETTLDLSAEVSQEVDASPGDITLASVRYDVWDQDGVFVGLAEGGVASDGMSTAIMEGILPGPYYVGVTVTGGFFASNPAPQVASLDLPVEPVQVNTAIEGSVYFTDADTPFDHGAVWEWGDGSECDASLHSECTLIEPSGSVRGEVTGSHTYGEPGVYRVRLTVTDGDGNAGQSVFEYVVVYDPAGGEGFVTGGGWIESPAGACADDPELTGQANFGFVARYKKGANTPTGQTEFQFQAGDLNFHSDSYDWLVVARAKAMFKGVGTINGEGNYDFLLSAVDAELTPSTDVDLFRIKIWDMAADQVVYDNQMGESENADPTTALGDGDIVIHPGK